MPIRKQPDIAKATLLEVTGLESACFNPDHLFLRGASDALAFNDGNY